MTDREQQLVDKAVKDCLDMMKLFEGKPDVYRDGLSLMADTALIALGVLDALEEKDRASKTAAKDLE
jgi:hypothetical protein